MSAGIKRREFISLLGGAVVAWPLAARAQQPAMPVVGFLSSRSPDDTANLVAAFRRGLADSGYIEGQTVTIEYKWALGQYDQLPGMATELVRRPVAVLVATGGEPAALAAKTATSTIPIVFSIGSDPVKAGLVASFNRPGGNITGINILTDLLEPKRLGLLHELVPQAETIGFIWNPRFASAIENQVRDAEEAARALALKLRKLPANHRRRNRCGVRHDPRGADSGACRQCRSVLRHPARQAYRLGSAPRGAHDVPFSRICGSRRSDELRRCFNRCLPPGRHLCCSHPHGCQACRPAGAAANQI